jgi:predicted transcriptional regulator
MRRELDISKLLGSDVKLELLALFHESPDLVEKLDGVGKRIGRSVNEIEAEVKDLVDIGVLRTRTLESSEFLYYDKKNDVDLQKQISYRLRKESASVESSLDLSHLLSKKSDG